LETFSKEFKRQSGEKELKRRKRRKRGLTMTINLLIKHKPMVK